MARSVETIYNEMVTEKQTAANLSGLMPTYNLSSITPDNPFDELVNEVDSESQVSVWRWWLYIVAYGMFILESLWDAFKTEILQIAAASEFGTQAWYERVAKEWQYGHSLVWDSVQRKAYYIDTTSPAAVASRLAAKVSVTEVHNISFSGVQIKVAKDVGGTLQPLDTAAGTELDSFTYYMERKSPAGIPRSIISIAADSIRFHLRRYYDGTLALADVQAADEIALKAYLKNIDFSGVFYVNDLVDAFQNLTTGKKPTVTPLVCEAKAATDTLWTTIAEKYEPKSGYFELVPIGAVVGLDTVIEYVAV